MGPALAGANSWPSLTMGSRKAAQGPVAVELNWTSTGDFYRIPWLGKTAGQELMTWVPKGTQ